MLKRTCWAVLTIAALILAVWGMRTRSAHAAAAPPIGLNAPVRLDPRFNRGSRTGQPVEPLTPLALAADDFDGDGLSDLAAGYAASDGTGRIAFLRGNPDAFAPQSVESIDAAARGQFLDPYLRDAQLVPIPSTPDFLAAGRFTGAATPTLLAASRGGRQVHVLSLDSTGALTLRQSIDLPGPISALATYDLHTGAYMEAAIGVHTDAGSQLLLYSGSPGGLTAVTSLALEHDAASFAFGNLDGDLVPDILILAGGSASVLHGATVAIEPVRVPYGVSATALGTFYFDQQALLQMALLDSSGTLHLLAHANINRTRYNSSQLAVLHGAAVSRPPLPAAPSDWQELENFPGAGLPDSSGRFPLLYRTRVSSTAADDLLLLGSGSLSIIAHPDQNPDSGLVLSRSDPAGDAVAALPVRVSSDPRPGLVFLQSSDASPYVLRPLLNPAGSFTVNTFSDGVHAGACAASTAGECTLREAILESNALSNSTISLSAGTYSLTLGRLSSPDYTGHSGALYVTSSVTITGFSAGTTTIQWGTPTNGGSVDQIFAVNQDVSSTTTASFSLSNVTLSSGVNHGTQGVDGDGGCMSFDTGTNGTATLSLSSVVFNGCSTIAGNGGGLALFNLANGSGSATLNQVQIENCSASQTTGAATGGGLWIADRASATSTGSVFQSNNATQQNGALGSGGGITVFSPGPNSNQSTLHGATVSSNAAAGFGGGIYTTARMLIDQGSIIESNTAGSASASSYGGGGMYLNVESPDTVTLTDVIVNRNSAIGYGGGIATGTASGAGALTMTYCSLAGNSSTSGGRNLYNDNTTVSATDDWWGTNSPSGTIITANSGSTTYDPYLVLSASASPSSIFSNQSTTLTADVSHDDHGTAITTSNVSYGSWDTVSFGSATLGAITTTQPVSLNSSLQAPSTYTAGSSTGTGTASVTLDQQSASVNITITALPSNPTISNAFGVSSIALNGSTTLTFTISNPNSTSAGDLTGIAFSDSLPASLTVSSTPAVSNSCGGTVTANAGSSIVSLSAGTLAHAQQCTISVSVTGGAAGSATNTTSAISATPSGTGSASNTATLSIVAPPTISAAFSPTSVAVNGTATLTFTITDPSGNPTALTGIAFTATLPSGLVVATPNNLSNTCGGTASAGSSPISLSGGSISTAGNTCTFSLSVKATQSGGLSVASGAITSTNGGSGSVSNTALLTAAGAPQITVSFAASSIVIGNATNLLFTISNPNPANSLTNVGFTSAVALPAGLTVSSGGVNNACGGTASYNSTANTMSLSGVSLAASAQCILNLTVAGGAAGTDTVAATATADTFGSGNTSSASLIVVAPPTIQKAFGAASVPLNGTTTLTFTLSNPNSAIALSNVSFADDLPGFGVSTVCSAVVMNSAGGSRRAGSRILRPQPQTGCSPSSSGQLAVASTPNVSSTCGGTLTANAGSTALSLSGGSLATSGACTVTVSVTGTAAGTANNTTSQVGSTEGGSGPAANASIYVVAPPSFSAAFNPTSVPLNGASTLGFTINNPAANTVSLTGVQFTGTLPTGLTVPSATISMCGGTLTTTSPTGIALSGASIAANSTCQINAITVTGAASGSYTVTTGAGGSNNGGSGATASASLSVASAASNTALTSSLNPSTYGQSVTFTAAVTPQTGSGTPTGSVVFAVDGSTIATGTLSGGVASTSISTLAVGTRAVTASYSGDSTYLSSASTTLGQVVNLGASNVALQSSLNPSALGQSVTFTATVTPQTGSGAPTSTVTFRDGVTTIGNATLSGGVAALTTTALASGPHSITAVYGGDGHYTAATSTAVTQTVQPLTPTVAVTSNTNPSVTGQLVTFTVTVTGSGATPTGTATVKVDGSPVGSVTLAAGAGTLTVAISATGSSRSVTAQYAGDSNYGAVSSPALGQTVNAAATTLGLSASSNPALSGTSVTFTATPVVTAPSQGAPSGSVTFSDGGNPIGTGTLSGGTATFSTSTLAVGPHNITAAYAGTAAFAASASSPLSETISSTGTSTQLSSSANPVVLGQSVTLTATVSSGGGPTPQGTLIFYNGATQIGTASLNGSGIGSFSTAALPAGTLNLTAAYSSSNGLNASTSGPLSQVVLVPVAVQASPAGVQFTVDGTSYTGAQTFNWAAGSPHSLGAPSPQSQGTGTQVAFSSWSDSGAAAHTITTPTAAASYTASFVTQYLVTVNLESDRRRHGYRRRIRQRRRHRHPDRDGQHRLRLHQLQRGRFQRLQPGQLHRQRTHANGGQLHTAHPSGFRQQRHAHGRHAGRSPRRQHHPDQHRLGHRLQRPDCRHHLNQQFQRHTDERRTRPGAGRHARRLRRQHHRTPGVRLADQRLAYHHHLPRDCDGCYGCQQLSGNPIDHYVPIGEQSMNLTMRPLAVLGLLVMGAWQASATSVGPYIVLDPANGAVAGTPGATVGWGFTIYGDPSQWITFDSSLLTESAPVGTYSDFIGQNGGPSDYALGPGATWTQSFSALSQTGIGQYIIDPGTPDASEDTGTFVIDYQYMTGDPGLGGAPTGSSLQLTLADGSTLPPFTIDVNAASSTPEPSTAVPLLLLALGWTAFKRPGFASRFRRSPAPRP